MKSWVRGLEKISLTRLQRELLSMPLKASKNNVDMLLKGNEIVLIAESEYIANQFLEKASKIGVICVLK
jgi:hypothetical protein